MLETRGLGAYNIPSLLRMLGSYLILTIDSFPAHATYIVDFYTNYIIASLINFSKILC